MTYEEHIARAMLLGLTFYPAYHGYANSLDDDITTWIDADTLEPFVFNDRYEVVVAAISKVIGDQVMPGWTRDPKWFNWREWT